MGKLLSAAVYSSLALVGPASAALEPIVMKGTKFFFNNGTQFYINGVAYQKEFTPGGSTSSNVAYTDPLADPDSCKRDIPLLQELGTNTIRTYAIDPTADHSGCMSQLDTAGIYVISDLSEPALSINRDSPSWNVDLYNRYIAVVDELSKYDNVIGFFAGNEVTNNNTNTAASAYVKAAVRDVKAYLKAKQDAGGRWLGVGYAANDDAQIRAEIAHYFNCGDQDNAIDYWGYNIYSWCGQSSFEASGYASQVDFFTNYSIPVFFAEYGCNTQGGADGRTWDEATALYSDQMTGVFSGGIVYMYFEEANDYGVVKIDDDTATKMKNFDALAEKIAAVDPTRVNMNDYQPSNSPQPCPNIHSDWLPDGENLPPKPNGTLCDCMYSSLSCKPVNSLKETAYGDIFGFICGQSAESCAGINGNVSTGVYGAYSMCNALEQLGYVLDQYYQSQGSSSSACDFEGSAQVVTPASISDTCKSMVEDAEAANKVAATATSAPGASSTGGSEKEGASAALSISTFTIGNLAVGLYALFAMGVGAGVLLL